MSPQKDEEDDGDYVAGSEELDDDELDEELDDDL